MFSYIKNTDVVEFDLMELIFNQSLINKKFPNPNRNSKFINVFDNMVGQISEEMYEANAEMKYEKYLANTPYYMTDCLLEEIVDVIMYTGSLLYETAHFFNIDIIDYIKKENWKYIYFPIKYTESIEDIKFNYFNPIYLNKARRQIYDRKYHKSPSKKQDNYEINLISTIIKESFINSTDIWWDIKSDYFYFGGNIRDIISKYFTINISSAKIHNEFDLKQTIEQKVSLIDNKIAEKENLICSL